MFLVFGIVIKVKSNLSPFNIIFQSCYSSSARQDNKSIRLRNKSQRGFRVKRYLAGQLLCSLVSQDFSNSTNGRHTSTTQALSGPHCSMKEGPGTFLYIYIYQVYCSKKVWFQFCVCVCFMLQQNEVSLMSDKNPNYLD